MPCPAATDDVARLAALLAAETGRRQQLEARLAALEARVGPSDGFWDAPLAPGQLVSGPRQLREVQEDVRGLREENARLRDELSSFSGHASGLLTRLQAQVQQLLAGGAAGPLAGGWVRWRLLVCVCGGGCGGLGAAVLLS